MTFSANDQPGLTKGDSHWYASSMKTANIGEAKAHFSDLIRRAESGEDVRILRNGVPIARIIAEEAVKKRTFAPDDGLGFVADDFDAPLPLDVLATFST